MTCQGSGKPALSNPFPTLFIFLRWALLSSFHLFHQQFNFCQTEHSPQGNDNLSFQAESTDPHWREIGVLFGRPQCTTKVVDLWLPNDMQPTEGHHTPPRPHYEWDKN